MGAYAELRGQLVRVSFVLPPCEGTQTQLVEYGGNHPSPQNHLTIPPGLQACAARSDPVQTWVQDVSPPKSRGTLCLSL